MEIEICLGAVNLQHVAVQDNWLLASVAPLDPRVFEMKRILYAEQRFPRAHSRRSIPPHRLAPLDRTPIREIGARERALTEQCLVDFLALGATSEDARGFVRQYGLFQRDDCLSPQFRAPAFVHAFIEHELFQASREVHVLQLETLWREHHTLLRIHETYERLCREKLRGSALKRSFHELSLEVGHRLREASPYVRFEGTHAIGGVVAATVLTALYALTWKQFLHESPLRRCERCRALFVLSRVSKEYCSTRCQVAAKQARWRRARRLQLPRDQRSHPE
jgi:hypothetical protein